MANVVAMLDEVGGQAIEQLRVRGRVGVAQVVGRLDEPAAEHGFPEAIDGRSREVGIVGRREPLRERLAAIAVASRNGRPGMRGTAGSPVRGLVTAPRADDFHISAAVEAGEHRGQPVIVVLRPAIERMIVAVGALQPHAQEHLR